MFPHDTPDATAGSPEPSQPSDQLSVTYGPIDAGSGHRGMPVIFTNVGSSMYSLSGYPKVTALNVSGEPVAQARPTPAGYLGGVDNDIDVPTVDLQPGQSASALLEAMAFHVTDGSPCTPYASMMVVPPGGSEAVPVEWECDGGCELQVHPVVPGETGRQQMPVS